LQILSGGRAERTALDSYRQLNAISEMGIIEFHTFEFWFQSWLRPILGRLPETYAQAMPAAASVIYSVFGKCP